MRRQILPVVAVALVAPLCALGAQQNFDTVTVRSQRVAEGIYMLIGAGGNIGVATGPDATYIIDDQYAPLTQKIEAAVRSVTGQPVKFVLNTHLHGDHTGGNENFGGRGLIIYAHDNVRTRMSKDQVIEQLKQTVPASPAAALPTVTFSDSMTLHFNGETVVVFHVAKAHTDGDAMMHFRNANVVHTGDVFIRGGFPFVDRSSGGTFRGIIAATEKLLAATDANTKYIPGHGALSDRTDVERYLKLLKTVRDRISAQIKLKKTVEQVEAADLLADLDPAAGKGFINGRALSRLVYMELTGK